MWITLSGETDPLAACGYRLARLAARDTPGATATCRLGEAVSLEVLIDVAAADVLNEGANSKNKYDGERRQEDFESYLVGDVIGRATGI
jgi:hypothetical protein